MGKNSVRPKPSAVRVLPMRAVMAVPRAANARYETKIASATMAALPAKRTPNTSHPTTSMRARDARMTAAPTASGATMSMYDGIGVTRYRRKIAYWRNSTSVCGSAMMPNIAVTQAMLPASRTSRT